MGHRSKKRTAFRSVWAIGVVVCALRFFQLNESRPDELANLSWLVAAAGFTAMTMLDLRNRRGALLALGTLLLLAGIAEIFYLPGSLLGLAGTIVALWVMWQWGFRKIFDFGATGTRRPHEES